MLMKRLTTRFSAPMELALFAGLFLVISYFVGFMVYDFGWYPHEEGSYLEMAERVYRGELPHRDFEDSSTGGLHFFHSLVVAFFSSLGPVEKWKEVVPGDFQTVVEPMGHSVLSSRLMLLLISSLVLIVFMVTLRRCVSAAVAFLIILACLLWGPAVYLVPTPSWYGSFAALAGLYLLLKFSETRNTGWLFASGVAAGVGFLFHQASGLLQILAGTLFLFYLDSEEAESESKEKSPSALWALKSGLVIGVNLLFLYFCSREVRLDTLLYFVSGPLVLSLGILYLEWTNPGGKGRLVSLLKILGVYGGALVFTMLPYLIPYVIRSGLGEFWHGALAQPFRASGYSGDPLFEMRDLVLLIPANIFVLVLWILHREKAPAWMVGLIIVSTAVGLFYAVMKGFEPAYYRQIWALFRALLPEAVIVAAVALVLVRRGVLAWDAGRRKLVALGVCYAACFTWLQFPDFSGISFLYSFPFLVFLVTVLVSAVLPHLSSGEAPTGRWLLGAAALVWLAFLSVFAWTFSFKADARFFAQQYIPRGCEDRLGLERAPVFVMDEDCRVYEGLMKSIEVCSNPNEYILAFPDCPEFFSYSGRRNPFRTYQIPRKDDLIYRAVVEAFEQHRIKVLIYNVRADMNRIFLKDAELMEYVRKQLPERSVYGDFIIYTEEEKWILWAKKQPTFGAERSRVLKRKWPWNERVVIEQKTKPPVFDRTAPPEEPSPAPKGGEGNGGPKASPQETRENL